jgi:dTMP kinase
LSLFIVFEGVEGCGKSTQARALYKHLNAAGIQATLTFEPGDTSLGRIMRRYLKREREMRISPLAELFLFAVARAQLVTEVIQPSLKKEMTVICDRYADSTLAYQGYGRGLELETIKIVNNIATQGIKPDLNILLDIPAKLGLTRKKQVIFDRFENEDISFHQRVRDGYLKLAAADPEHWFIVDATLSRREINKIIVKKIENLLK